MTYTRLLALMTLGFALATSTFACTNPTQPPPIQAGNDDATPPVDLVGQADPCAQAERLRPEVGRASEGTLLLDFDTDRTGLGIKKNGELGALNDAFTFNAQTAEFGANTPGSPHHQRSIDGVLGQGLAFGGPSLALSPEHVPEALPSNQFPTDGAAHAPDVGSPSYYPEVAVNPGTTPLRTTSAWTIAGWVRVGRNTGGQNGKRSAKSELMKRMRIFGSYQATPNLGHALGYDDGELVYMIGDGSTTEKLHGSAPVGRWVHAAFTFDGALARLYLNGRLVDSLYGFNYAPLNKSFALGGNPIPTKSNGFVGDMDEVWFTPSAMSAAQLRRASFETLRLERNPQGAAVTRYGRPLATPAHTLTASNRQLTIASQPGEPARFSPRAQVTVSGRLHLPAPTPQLLFDNGNATLELEDNNGTLELVWRLELEGTTHIALRTPIDASRLASGVWVSGTFDGEFARLYLDGELHTSAHARLSAQCDPGAQGGAPDCDDSPLQEQAACPEDAPQRLQPHMLAVPTHATVRISDAMDHVTVLARALNGGELIERLDLLSRYELLERSHEPSLCLHDDGPAGSHLTSEQPPITLASVPSGAHNGRCLNLDWSSQTGACPQGGPCSGCLLASNQPAAQNTTTTLPDETTWVLDLEIPTSPEAHQHLIGFEDGLSLKFHSDNVLRLVDGDSDLFKISLRDFAGYTLQIALSVSIDEATLYFEGHQVHRFLFRRPPRHSGVWRMGTPELLEELPLETIALLHRVSIYAGAWDEDTIKRRLAPRLLEEHPRLDAVDTRNVSHTMNATRTDDTLRHEDRAKHTVEVARSFAEDVGAFQDPSNCSHPAFREAVDWLFDMRFGVWDWSWEHGRSLRRYAVAYDRIAAQLIACEQRDPRWAMVHKRIRAHLAERAWRIGHLGHIGETPNQNGLGLLPYNPGHYAANGRFRAVAALGSLGLAMPKLRDPRYGDSVEYVDTALADLFTTRPMRGEAQGDALKRYISPSGKYLEGHGYADESFLFVGAFLMDWWSTTHHEGPRPYWQADHDALFRDDRLADMHRFWLATRLPTGHALNFGTGWLQGVVSSLYSNLCVWSGQSGLQLLPAQRDLYAWFLLHRAPGVVPTDAWCGGFPAPTQEPALFAGGLRWQHQDAAISRADTDASTHFSILGRTQYATSGHIHADQLSISLMHKGNQLILDPGDGRRWKDTDKSQTIEKDVVREAIGHNVLVDSGGPLGDTIDTDVAYKHTFGLRRDVPVTLSGAWEEDADAPVAHIAGEAQEWSRCTTGNATPPSAPNWRRGVLNLHDRVFVVYDVWDDAEAPQRALQYHLGGKTTGLVSCVYRDGISEAAPTSTLSDADDNLAPPPEPCPNTLELPAQGAPTGAIFWKPHTDAAEPATLTLQPLNDTRVGWGWGYAGHDPTDAQPPKVYRHPYIRLAPATCPGGRCASATLVLPDVPPEHVAFPSLPNASGDLGAEFDIPETQLTAHVAWEPEDATLTAWARADNGDVAWLAQANAATPQPAGSYTINGHTIATNCALTFFVFYRDDTDAWHVVYEEDDPTNNPTCTFTLTDTRDGASTQLYPPSP